MTTKEILERILFEQKITYAELARKMGLTRAQMLYDLRDGKVKKISESYAKKIMEAFPGQYNRVWLLTGENEQKGDVNTPTGVNVKKMLRQDNAVMFPAERTGGVPFYDRSIECGTPADFNACIEASKADGRIMLPNIQGDFALVAHGDSMVDAEHPDRSIPSGAIVVLRKVDEAAFIRWGEVYALATRDGFVIKRIMPLDGDNIECHSLNSIDFPPFRVSKSDIFGVARVVAVVNYRLY